MTNEEIDAMNRRLDAARGTPGAQEAFERRKAAELGVPLDENGNPVIDNSPQPPVSTNSAIVDSSAAAEGARKQGKTAVFGNNSTTDFGQFRRSVDQQTGAVNWTRILRDENGNEIGYQNVDESELPAGATTTPIKIKSWGDLQKNQQDSAAQKELEQKRRYQAFRQQSRDKRIMAKGEANRQIETLFGMGHDEILSEPTEGTSKKWRLESKRDAEGNEQFYRVVTIRDPQLLAEINKERTNIGWKDSIEGVVLRVPANADGSIMKTSRGGVMKNMDITYGVMTKKNGLIDGGKNAETEFKTFVGDQVKEWARQNYGFRTKADKSGNKDLSGADAYLDGLFGGVPDTAKIATIKNIAENVKQDEAKTAAAKADAKKKEWEATHQDEIAKSKRAKEYAAARAKMIEAVRKAKADESKNPQVSGKDYLQGFDTEEELIDNLMTQQGFDPSEFKGEPKTAENPSGKGGVKGSYNSISPFDAAEELISKNPQKYRWNNGVFEKNDGGKWAAMKDINGKPITK